MADKCEIYILPFTLKNIAQVDIQEDLFCDKSSLLNQRSELNVNCRHSLPFSLEYG